MTEPLHRRRSTHIALWLAAGLLPAATAHAEADRAPQVLAPIEVTSTRLATPWIATPAAVGTVDTALQFGDAGLALSESLNRLPGIYTQSVYNLNQSLRVSVRGFGSRAAFGVRGLRVLVDDIPLTMPDGQTELDALDLALIERVEVLRGPSSALYGNGAGGVIALNTRSRPEAQWGRVDAAIGELGDRRLRAELGGQGERVGGLLSLAHREVDGPREHMAADSLIGAGRLSLQFAPGTLTLSMATLEIDAQDPAALTRAEWATNRRMANPGALTFDVGESIRQQRLGATWQQALGEATDLRLRGWAGERDFSNRLPFANGGQSAFERRFGGVGAQIDHRQLAFGATHTSSLGADFETQRDDRQRYSHTAGGLRGAQTLDQSERARGFGVFLGHQAVWQGLTAGAGLRYDRIRLSVDDHFLGDGDDSGTRDFDRVSGSIGLGWQLAPGHLLFSRYGTGFETPANNELANPGGGGFNPDLGPALARNIEIGWKHDRTDLRTELVLYRIRNKDELVRFELPGQPGRSFFRNAGITDRDGAELSLQWQTPWAPLAATLAYSYNDFRFRRFVQGGNDFSGNALPGLPQQQLFAELALRPLPGWTARLQTVALDRLYADDANSERVAGYALVNARLSWQGERRGVQLAPYIALNNLFDRDYVDNLRVNAAAGRYFEPGPGRVVIGGVSITF